MNASVGLTFGDWRLQTVTKNAAVKWPINLGDLTTYHGSLAQIHLLIRTFYFAENASALSRILFKDSELKKMERMDNFIKVNSDVIIQQL